MMSEAGRSRHRSGPSARRPRERGFGLVGMAAILAVLAVGACVVYMSVTTYQRKHATSEQQSALNWADSLLRSYVQQHGQLPCPASQQLGAQDCQAWYAGQGGAKWLPVQTLLGGADVAGSSVSAAMRQVTYQPYRGTGAPAAPDLLAAPAGEYMPAVGEITVGNGAGGINGASSTAMGNYRAVPGSLDFCQQLQNLALGIAGAAAIQPLALGESSAVAPSGQVIDPWTAPASTISVYTLAGGVGGQTLAISVSQLHEALQCEILHASADVLASTASLSEPGGMVQATQGGMLDGESGWVDNSSTPAGTPGWGSYEWMSQILVPQIVGVDWLFSSLRLSQATLVITKQARDLMNLSMGLLDPVALAETLASVPFYLLADARRATDLGSQTLASVADTAYQVQYNNIVSELQALQLWGAPADAGAQPLVSAADNVEQQAVQLGLAWATAPTPAAP